VSPERFRKVEKLYHEALEREPVGRTSFLADACRGDDELKGEVESLLEQRSASGTDILDLTPAELVTEASATELAPHTVLGHYRIEERIGAGGMGTVYKATDTKLRRVVALKLLRVEMLGDGAAHGRFEREARTLASMNHPHIATIYGFEEHQGISFLALEYIPGATLAERLRRGPLPIHDAMLVCSNIADALEAAHAQGIVHRDLKPANIKVGENGDVKVLDFGLAKPVPRMKIALSTDSTGTVTERITDSIAIVGTAAYMSPEQASGKPVDARTDIWAFGCVLYEALSGKQAFRRDTTTELLAAVIESEPDWKDLPAATPQRIELLLRRCLRKDPHQRLRDIGDARIELEDLLAGPAEHDSVPQAAAMTRRTVLGALSGAAVGVAATGAFAISRYSADVPRKLTRFAIMAPEGNFVPSFATRIGISRDGTCIAFNTVAPDGNAFYIRALQELESKRLKEVRNGAAGFFSPDGRWIAYFTLADPMTLSKMALSGGAAVTLSTVDGMGGTWAEGDEIYWMNQNPGVLASIPAAGGQTRKVADIDFAKGERQHKFPCALPGGDTVLLTVSTADTPTFDEARIVALSPASGQKKLLLEGGTQPRYSPSGHLLYARDGKILAVRFDLNRLRVEGQPFTVVEGVQMSRNTGAASFDISANGDLAYVSGMCDGGARTLVWVDRNGKSEAVPLAAKSYLHPRLSPDDRRLAIEVEGPNHDLYVYDFDRSVLANITTDGVSHWPVWSPDGKELAYRSGPMGHFTLWRVPADRSSAPQKVPATGVSQNAESWSPDGRAIAYIIMRVGVPTSIMVADVHGGSAESFSKEKAPEGSPKFSPDGRWLAYCSAESGKPQVYVQAFPGPGPKIQVSNEGGTDPVWKRAGGELFYRNGDSMMAVAVSTGGDLKAGRPQELWKGHYSHGMSSSCGPPGATSSNYDVTADGKRFLMIKDDDQDRAASKQIVVALGWAEELSRIGAKA
jgi:serine/threonine-protein kinase